MNYPCSLIDNLTMHSLDNPRRPSVRQASLSPTVVDHWPRLTCDVMRLTTVQLYRAIKLVTYLLIWQCIAYTILLALVRRHCLSPTVVDDWPRLTCDLIRLTTVQLQLPASGRAIKLGWRTCSFLVVTRRHWNCELWRIDTDPAIKLVTSQ